MDIRQSSLSSYARCAQQKKLYDLAAQGIGPQPESLSRTAYGTVVHHALQVMETEHFNGNPAALAVARSSFAHYWHPDHIEELPGTKAVDRWLVNDSYGVMRAQGLERLDLYYDQLTHDNGLLLALEMPFRLPIDLGDLGVHYLTGTMDRLCLRRKARQPYVSVEDFKGLALDTPLPTPIGWTTMGAVQVGDEVLGRDGRPTRVLVKSQPRQRDCYRVTFDDTSSVVCDDEHLWETVSKDGRRVLSTLQLRDQLFTHDARPQRHQRIFNAEPLDLPAVALPIDPYVLGVWLGDGRAAGGELCKPEPDIFAEIARRGWKVGPDTAHGKRAETHTIYGLRTALRTIGLLANKGIPDVYLRASRQQRLDLLRGLMDTDGSWHRKRNRAVFTNCDKALAASVHELVASLGMKPTTFEVQRVGFGLTVTAYDVCFSPLEDNPFFLPRKAALVRRGTIRSRRRLVVSVEPVPSVTTQCIQVDNADSMYLCGEGMVPTHNTGKRPTFLRHAIQWTVYCYATTQRDFWAPFPDADERWQTYADWPRRGTWIDMKVVKRVDCGERVQADYDRMILACREYVKAHVYDVFPLSISGEHCEHCAFSSTCAGVGLADVGDYKEAR